MRFNSMLSVICVHPLNGDLQIKNLHVLSGFPTIIKGIMESISLAAISMLNLP